MKYIDLSIFLIRNKIVKWIILSGIITSFFFLFSNIKRYAFPRVEFFEINVSTVAPNYSVEEVERNITIPIEEKLDIISGIKSYTSSSYNNLSFLNLELERDSDIRTIQTDIRNAIDEIDFPKVVTEKPKIVHIKIDNKAIFELGIISDDENFDKIRQHALELRDRLKRIPLVSGVRKINIPDKKIWILLDKQKMFENKVTFDEVINAIKKFRFNVPAGDIEYIDTKKNVITLNEFNNLKDIENVLVRVTRNFNFFDGVGIRIKDLGTVKSGFSDLDEIYRFNGHLGVGLNVVKKNTADIIGTAEEVLDVVEAYQKEVATLGIKIIVHENDAEETNNRINIAYSNGVVGLVLILFILVIFLDYKIAIWTSFGISFVFVGTMIIMSIFNLSINNISLAGIIITLGIIVDDAVIVGESIFRFKQLGYANEASVIKGLKIVMRPLLFALITTILSFFSMFFIPGVIGDFAIEIPLVVIFMLSVSFFESTVILPSHLGHIRFKGKEPWGNKLINRISFIYQKILRKILKKPYRYFFSLIFIFVLMGFIAVQFTSFYLFPIDQSFRVIISGETNLKDGKLANTLLSVKKIEKIIYSLPEKSAISSIKAVIGKKGNDTVNVSSSGGRENQFNIQINLVPFLERKVTAEEVKNFVFKKIENSPNLNVKNLDYYIYGGGPPQGKPIEINIFGYDDEDRFKMVDKIIKDMKKSDYFSEIQSDYDEGLNTDLVTVLDKTYYASINPAKIAEALRIALTGITIDEIQYENEKVDLDVKFNETILGKDNFLKGIFIFNNFNQLVEAKNFVKISSDKRKQFIIRKDGERVNVISANFNKNLISAKGVDTFLKEKYINPNKKNPSLRITTSGEAKESASTFNQFLIAIIFSIIGIYLLLVIQFNHILQPLMVITSIPFGIIGIIIAFSIQGLNLSLLAMIGILGFGGVVINVSLLMVDVINKIKAGKFEDMGVDLNEFAEEKNYQYKSVIIGANIRLRPIIITTLTTLIGIAPTAYGFWGRTDSTISPMTMAMFWGLFFGTLVSLFLIPLLYVINDRMTDRVYNLFKK